jgi:hypothetical protein
MGYTNCFLKNRIKMLKKKQLNRLFVNENQTLEKNIDEKAICVIIFVAQFMHELFVLHRLGMKPLVERNA